MKSSEDSPDQMLETNRVQEMRALDQRDQSRSPRLLDLLAMVVGFGAAAALMRSLWPTERDLQVSVAIVAGVLYLWLGLAMTGPILLLLDRRGLNDATRQLSWPQVAWMLIGSYWLVILALVVPTRLDVHPVLGMLPIAAALILRVLSPPSVKARIRNKSWTDRIAVGLMYSWPVAWGALILLGKTFL